MLCVKLRLWQQNELMTTHAHTHTDPNRGTEASEEEEEKVVERHTRARSQKPEKAVSRSYFGVMCELMTVDLHTRKPETRKTGIQV